MVQSNFELFFKFTRDREARLTSMKRRTFHALRSFKNLKNNSNLIGPCDRLLQEDITLLHKISRKLTSRKWLILANYALLCLPRTCLGWSGGVKVSCILRHRGVKLILACSWARSAILVAGKGKRECFCNFIPVPLSSLSSSFISSTISSISFLPFSGRRHKG